MFTARAVNHKINRLQERGLRAQLNNETSLFKDMLSKRNDTTVNVRNTQKLKIEFFKYFYGLSPPIIKQVFAKIVLKYNRRICSLTFLTNPKNKKYGKIR